MLSIAESDDESSIMLVSDKPKAVIPLSDGRAEALHAQLGLMIRTRKARKGEPVKPDVALDEPEAAEAAPAVPQRPGPAPVVIRGPGGELIYGGAALLGMSDRAAAEARDAAEIASRKQKSKSSAADDARVARRAARLAKIGRDVEAEAEEEAGE